jgi:2-succinyl-5-enolpyruvyl-6-hydroxy-3-cyclohexene-1-carboxylate synthase
MYSDKENVNILTALLVAHGIRHAVCCPGSRNSPIVHNLNACPDIQCYPVTDERSAGFYALGMCQCLQAPVVVCVTSGTALLNLAPAVAEAYYQHTPLVVISADRPQAWIDQLDGQTLPQPDALGRFVKKAVSLPEPHDNETRWYCNRLVNEALIVRHAPVHINVPISEPLFNYAVSELPTERKINLIESDASTITQSHVVRMFLQAKRPMLISGQPMNPNMDEAIYMIGDDERYVPDFVLYTGGSIVSKRLKRFLRQAKETWTVNRAGEVTDTFQNLTHVIQGDGEVIADLIRFNLEQQPHPFVQLWEALLAKVRAQAAAYEPDYSQMAAVKYFEWRQASGGRSHYHYANSTAIRLANIYANHPVYCNRGVNGIEGSLSTAAGFSVVLDEKVFCVIGDLSFFYDQNALWNQNLKGNLRILLLNNGKGGIFNMLKGLEQSPARDRFVAAEHHTSADGFCMQNHVTYLKATNMEEMHQGIDTLLHIESDRPILLEVFTDPVEDERVFKDYYHSLGIINIKT